MNIDEMNAWLERIEPGTQDCAVKDSFRLGIEDPQSRSELETAILPLRGTDQEAYLLALGHLIGMCAIGIVIDNGRLARMGKSSPGELFGRGKPQ